jgi:hypothetical protein
MGHHDPLDGFVTCVEIEATAAKLSIEGAPELAIADYANMLARQDLATEDPLGIGGLLVDASRLAQLEASPRRACELVAAAEVGLRRHARARRWEGPVDRRLAFRELGLAIGLGAAERTLGRAAAPIREHFPLRARIESFWSDANARKSRTWREHQDINDVMLATSLEPDGFVALG